MFTGRALPKYGTATGFTETPFGFTGEQYDWFNDLVYLRVSDSPLPETNHHLPLGIGSIDFADYCGTLLQGGFDGVAILEIGGLPKSGGYGRDTDEALCQSRALLSGIVKASRDQLV